ncbi:hypothetical protein NCH01_30780 [Neoasaia chiangmaiensis]|nr:hypothetical protein NCH01_30780 [Neoasaia chiangmaiensis]
MRRISSLLKWLTIAMSLKGELDICMGFAAERAPVLTMPVERTSTISGADVGCA